jgi:hypothetical protein
MRQRVAVHRTGESYVFDHPRAGIEIEVHTDGTKVILALDFSAASDLARQIQAAVGGGRDEAVPDRIRERYTLIPKDVATQEVEIPDAT